MKSLSIKSVMITIIVSCLSFGMAAQSATRMSDEERAYSIKLVKHFETEFIFLHGQIVSFLQLSTKNNKGQNLPNKTPFRQYVAELSECVDRFEKNAVTDVVEAMNHCENHDSGFYKSLVIVYDACSTLLPPLKTLRSVLMKYVSSNDKGFMAKKIAQEIETTLLKMPLEQTWNNVDKGFTRLKALMVQIDENDILAEIASIETKLESIHQSFIAMNIGVSTIVAALNQKLRNNTAA